MLPTYLAANEMVRIGNLNMLKKLSKHGIYPSLDAVIEVDNLKLIKWLEKNGVIRVISEEFDKLAKEKGDPVEWAVRQCQIPFLEWLLQNKYPISDEILTWAYDYANDDIVALINKY